MQLTCTCLRLSLSAMAWDMTTKQGYFKIATGVHMCLYTLSQDLNHGSGQHIMTAIVEVSDRLTPVQKLTSKDKQAMAMQLLSSFSV